MELETESGRVTAMRVELTQAQANALGDVIRNDQRRRIAGASSEGILSPHNFTAFDRAAGKVAHEAFGWAPNEEGGTWQVVFAAGEPTYLSWEARKP